MIRRRYNLSFPCDDADAMRAYHILREEKISGKTGTSLVIAALLAYIDNSNLQQQNSEFAKEIARQVAEALLPFFQQEPNPVKMSDKTPTKSREDIKNMVLQNDSSPLQEQQVDSSVTKEQADLSDALGFLNQLTY